MTTTAGDIDTQACVIGAGPSGLAAAKALVDRGISFDWFEKGSMVGGLWRIDNDNGGAAAYERCGPEGSPAGWQRDFRARFPGGSCGRARDVRHARAREAQDPHPKNG